MSIKRTYAKKSSPIREMTEQEKLILEQQRQLDEQKALIAAQIQEIEEEKRRKKEAEEIQRQQAIEARVTLPPLTEILDRDRERKFMDKLSRGQLANERRAQAKNGLLLILLFLAIFAVGAWIYSMASAGL